MRLLGIDFGENRVGIAITDEEGRIAFPHAVFPNSLTLMSDIVTLVREKDIGTVVIGESKTLGGADNPIMDKIRRFKKDLEREVAIRVVREPAQRPLLPKLPSKPERLPSPLLQSHSVLKAAKEKELPKRAF